MWTYNDARAHFTHTRTKPDRHIGRRVRQRTYNNYDPEHDRFVFSDVQTKCISVTDPSTGQTGRIETRDKSLWTMRPWAYIYPDRIEIIDLCAPGPLWALFEVRISRPRSIKLSGMCFTRRYVYDESVQGELPLIILPSGKLQPAPPKVRVFDKEKRAEMNQLIKTIRRELKLRAKLGTFNRLVPSELNERMAKQYHKSGVLDSPEQFVAIMRAVDPGNVESFHTLLWLADRRWYYADRHDSYGNTDWVARFENLVASMREKMRKGMGVVSYVDPETLEP